MSKIGLLFGSFNPVHNGHLAIAKAGLKDAGCKKVWLVLQEANPYKDQGELATGEDRLRMLRLAVGNSPDVKLVVSRAGSMVKGLAQLAKHYPKDQFVLLMGQDLVEGLSKWKDHDKLINKYQIYAYQRSKSINISSELVRECVTKDQSIRHLVPKDVASYIKVAGLYS